MIIGQCDKIFSGTEPGNQTAVQSQDFGPGLSAPGSHSILSFLKPLLSASFLVYGTPKWPLPLDDSLLLHGLLPYKNKASHHLTRVPQTQLQISERGNLIGPALQPDVHSSTVSQDQGDRLTQCTAYFAGTVGINAEKHRECLQKDRGRGNIRINSRKQETSPTCLPEIYVPNSLAKMVRLYSIRNHPRSCCTFVYFYFFNYKI